MRERKNQREREKKARKREEEKRSVRREKVKKQSEKSSSSFPSVFLNCSTRTLSLSLFLLKERRNQKRGKYELLTSRICKKYFGQVS